MVACAEKPVLRQPPFLRLRTHLRAIFRVFPQLHKHLVDPATTARTLIYIYIDVEDAEATTRFLLHIIFFQSR